MRGVRGLKAHEVRNAAWIAGLGRTPLWRAARLPAAGRDFRRYGAGYSIHADVASYNDEWLVTDVMAKRKIEEVLAVEGNAAKAKTAKRTKDLDITEPKKRRSASPKSTLVERVNQQNIRHFQEAFVDTERLQYRAPDNKLAVDISLQAADWLTPGEHNASFNLVKTTSQQDYEASTWGWRPKNKRKEMLEPEMKYLFIRRAGTEPTIERRKDGDMDTSIEGFVSFMVTHDSLPVVPVIYIYEIHLAESLRGIRLGQHMMGLVESIGRNVDVKKVMLTCFLCNEKAHGFYKSLGYRRDVSSPEDRKTRNKVVKVDYEIMSKII